MKRSQSDVSLSKSQEAANGISILEEKLNCLEVTTIEEEITNTNSNNNNNNSTNNNNNNNNNKVNNLRVIAPPYTTPPTTSSPLITPTSSIYSDKKFFSSSPSSATSSATSTPTLVSEKQKPKKTLSVTSFDLSAGDLVPSKNKKHILNGSSTIGSSGGDVSPKKVNKMKSVSNFFKKSTSHNNLLDVPEQSTTTTSDSPSLNSSSSSISSTNSSYSTLPVLPINITLTNNYNISSNTSNSGSITPTGSVRRKEESFKSKIDSFFNSGTGKNNNNNNNNNNSRSSIKYDSNGNNLLDFNSSDDSDFDSDSDDEPPQKKSNKKNKLKLFTTSSSSSSSHQRSKSKEEQQLSSSTNSTTTIAAATTTIDQTSSSASPICNSNSINSTSIKDKNKKKLERKSISDPNILTLINEESSTPTQSPRTTTTTTDETTATNTNTNTNNEEEEETEEQDLKKSLERRLIRRPTVAELKLDNIIFQSEFEDVAKEQTKIEINNQKLFIGTRPSKKKFFNTPAPNVNSINVSLLKFESNQLQLENNKTNNETSSTTPTTTNENEFYSNDDSENNKMNLVLSCQGWRKEIEMQEEAMSNSNSNSNNNNNNSNNLCIEEIENEFPHYVESFMKDRHKNYLANNQDDLGPVVISIKREAERTPSYRKLKKKKKENNTFITEASQSCPNLSVHNNNPNLSQQQQQQQTSSSSSSLQKLTQQQQPTTAAAANIASPILTPITTPTQNFESTERKFKTIIRTKDGEDRFYLSSGKSSPHELINTIKSFFLSDYPELQFQKIPNNSETRKMLQYWETAQMTKEYKFGILYRKNQQVNENDFFSNKDESPEFKEFLEFIGEKVKLKGFDRFKGGLDIKNDTTGTHSVFNTKEVSINESKKFDVSIMFHVSTYLPHYPNDQQQLERKRHIGNDIVVIIFQDLNCQPPFKPNMIKSEFNHVFVVIQPLEKTNPNEITKYSVSITYKEGVSTCSPFFSPQKIWKKDNVFLDNLLTKLINAEKASYYSPSFSDKMKRTRLILLKNIVSTTLK